MTDVHSKKIRSKNMAAIKGRNTKPERSVRSLLRHAGFPGYRLNVANLPGKPDITYVGRRTAVFVHGCFWHQHPGCKLAATVKTDPDGKWAAKLRANAERDRRNITALEANGWKVFVVWECEVSRRAVSPIVEHLQWIQRKDSQAG